MFGFLNPAIYGNWENWVRVYLMALIGFVVFDLTMRLILKEKAGE